MRPPVPFLNRSVPTECGTAHCSPFQCVSLRPVYDEAITQNRAKFRSDVRRHAARGVFCDGIGMSFPLVPTSSGDCGCSGWEVTATMRAAMSRNKFFNTKINWIGFRCALDAENKTGTEGHRLLEYKLTGLIPDRKNSI